jgi:competence protein ComEC
LTGLSPSVLRAVTMFSFLGLTSVIKRVGLPLQQLWLSMITLILIKPSLVYEVGFQLSYSAVFGILWVMPKIQAFYRSKKVILKEYGTCLFRVALHNYRHSH